MSFELTNEQRTYFGLEPIEPHWDKVQLEGDAYRPVSYLYFDGNTIKRYILSNDLFYKEQQYNEATLSRKVLVSKTGKGKDKKLTASVLEQRKPQGVYLSVDKHNYLLIANHTTDTTYYSSKWEDLDFITPKPIAQTIDEYIRNSPSDHFSDIRAFSQGQRKNVKFKAGDYFCYKLSRTQYGFGRVLLDINKIRKKGLLCGDHGLNIIMGPPVLVKLYIYSSPSKHIDLTILESVSPLPSGYMMDSYLLYGEYEIVGHRVLREDEFEFPVSYGRWLDHRKPVVFLQWGIMHKELPVNTFNKYLAADNPFVPENSFSKVVRNPYGFYSVGFTPSYDTTDVHQSLPSGQFSFAHCNNFSAEFDLRNPKNEHIRCEILKAFNVDPAKSYKENCKLNGVEETVGLLPPSLV